MNNFALSVSHSIFGNFWKCIFTHLYFISETFRGRHPIPQYRWLLSQRAKLYIPLWLCLEGDSLVLGSTQKGRQLRT